MATLSNKDEKDRSARLNKLNHETVLIELEMKTATEGCTIIQLNAFCNRHNVTYYALDYKWATFATNAGDKSRKRTHLPPLYFMVGCAHLYPITNELQQRSITRINCKTGGLCKMNKSNERDKGNTRVIVAHDAHILEYWVQKDIQELDLLDNDDELRIVCTEKTWLAITFMIYCNEVRYMDLVYLFKIKALQGPGCVNDLLSKKTKNIMMLNVPLIH